MQRGIRGCPEVAAHSLVRAGRLGNLYKVPRDKYVFCVLPKGHDGTHKVSSDGYDLPLRPEQRRIS